MDSKVYAHVKGDLASAMGHARCGEWCGVKDHMMDSIAAFDRCRGQERSNARRMITRRLHKLADMLHKYADTWHEEE